MNVLAQPLWKKAPFVRLVIPFVVGVVVQFYSHNPHLVCAALFAFSLTAIYIYSFLPLSHQFSHYWLCGILFNLLLFSTGGIMAIVHDPFAARNRVNSFADKGSVYFATLLEPPAARKSSWKALASLDIISNGKELLFPHTDIILYFRKEAPAFGQQLVFRRRLQPITNMRQASFSRFDYRQYCALKNIHYQVFLSPGEYRLFSTERGSAMKGMMFAVRDWVIATVGRGLTNGRERGLALALLIGYKDGLDKDLIQSYSNTGVVHVIAISGLHLGLIYGMLRCCFGCLRKYRGGRWLAGALVLAGLWSFSFLAGASPSVLRSAVMFTFIVLGDCTSRKTSLINNLALSAFFLLCVDPYWLWDLGFILSYAALLSIAIFQQDIYQLFIIRNRVADELWKLNAVTLSAQLLSMPVIIYNFGQFPTLFLITNVVAIPLSSLILLGEIFLCAVNFIPALLRLSGIVITALIRWMNGMVAYMDRFQFSSVHGLYINFLQVILLYVFIAFFSSWLMARKKGFLPASLVTATLFFVAGWKIWQ